MSVYREPGRRRARAIVIAAVAALLTGGVAGFAIGRGTAGEPSLFELIEDAREGLRPALNALELVTIEYPESVRGGEVVARTEYEAALSQAQAATRFLSAGRADLEPLDRAGFREAASRAAYVSKLIEQRAGPAKVKSAAAAASLSIKFLMGETVAL